MSDFFGKMFDFNHDGELDGFEEVADFAMFTSLMEDDETETEKSVEDDTNSN